MSNFVITGMSRSGTTLLEKMLSSHQKIHVLSQPMPFLYRYIKERFYKQIGYPDTYYVLNDLFDENIYRISEFTSWLGQKRFTGDEVRNVLESMKGYQGQLESAHKILKASNGFKIGDFASVYKRILDHFRTDGQWVMGSKEILLEEFIPYFISNQIKVVHIIRDPRDVISSIISGKGPVYTGKRRPILFHLRNWRKSISIMNSLEDETNVFTVKYEDLISNAGSVSNLITDFLGVNNFGKNHFENGLSQNGNEWKGNSSNGRMSGIDKNNKGKYKSTLAPNVIKYIEYLCYPEMMKVGYDLLYEPDFSSYDPLGFTEPYPIEVDDLDSKMSSSSKEIEREQIRLGSLSGKINLSGSEIFDLFISEKNFQKLREAYR